jgi:hypothetical protein
MARVISMSGTVHIVHDDASFRTSTGRLLRACGYAVEDRITDGCGGYRATRNPL